MKNKLIIFICFVISACGYDSSDKFKKILKPVAFTFSKKNLYFENKSITLTIDSLNNSLCFSMNLHLPANFPYPINNTYKDTLTKTAFTFEFYQNNKPIFSLCNTQKAWGYIKQKSGDSVALKYYSDTVDLNPIAGVSFQIPFYAFYNLKKGEQEIEVRISQRVFRSAKEQDSTYQVKGFEKPSHKYFYLYAEKSIINAAVKCKIKVPAIHKTILYNEDIVLRNDSVYNPYASDNTIWKSSLPDLYWAVYYPKNVYYVSSDYQTSTMLYDAKDTFEVYHYFLQDSISFGVYDHDNLSRDDIIAFKAFAIRDVQKNKVRNVTFDGVKSFTVRGSYKGVVNR